MPTVYHIVHYKNLVPIIKAGKLWCDKERRVRVTEHVSIAHDHIKQRRESRQVPGWPGGSLADYVPFYFAPRSPMLYAIAHGFVEGYDDGENPIVHLVAETDQIVGRRKCIFTDRHAVVQWAHYSSDLSQLHETIDWDLMQATLWKNTNEFPDRKERRQAEFLVHGFLPWDLVSAIGVKTRQVELTVQRILSASENPPELRIRRQWYYI